MKLSPFSYLKQLIPAAILPVLSLIYLPVLLDFSLSPRFTAMAAAACFFMLALLLRNVKLQIPLDLPVTSYALYTAFCCAGIFWSLNTAEAIFSAGRVVLGCSVFIAAVWLLHKNHRRFMQVLFLAALFITVATLAVTTLQLMKTVTLSKVAMYQITGLHSHKNLLSSFLFLTLVFMILGISVKKGRAKQAYVICTILTLMALLLLRTKAVWFGLLTAGLVLLLSWLVPQRIVSEKWRNLLPVILTVCVLLFWLFICPFLLEIAFAHMDTDSPFARIADKERLQLWQNSLEMYHRQTKLGVGPGNWQIYFPDNTLSGIWRAEDLNYTFQRPHNDHLWVLTENGLPGFLLFSFFVLCIMTNAWFSALASKGIQKTQLLICVAFIAGFMTISAFDFPRERMEHTLWFNILLAVSYQYARSSGKLTTFTLNRTAYIILFLLFISLFVCGAFRMKGEYFTRKLYDHRNGGDLPAMIKSANKAESFFYDLDPTSVPLAWYRANAFADLGNLKDATAAFEAAMHKNPFNRNVLNDLASAYVMQGNIEKAIPLYKEAARISPRFDEAKLNLAAVLITQKKFAEADSCLHTIFHDSERRNNYQKIVDANLR